MCVRTVVGVMLLLAVTQSASANLHFFAELNGANVAPTPVATLASGYATAEHDAALGTVSVHIHFSGMSSEVIGAKIHCCGDELNSTTGAAIDMEQFGFPTGSTSGNFIYSFPMTDANTYVPAYLAESSGHPTPIDHAHYRLVDSMARVIDIVENGYVYVNIETELNPGGELRGNINQAPEPSSLALLIGGLAAFIGLRRRNRR